ncbi:hypothetical protein [Thalassovita mangrovi]|uniref:Uncharacterized protein n=1 Tax=Thalassovita mangrovi TaxID=2692236 RepID=A0A6L8LMR7_9RHOB|nr:hypothetical protein [Thalassovita mangrovi]MYM54429.1 hypothetical protein [Thalassovita mangrovi]
MVVPPAALMLDTPTGPIIVCVAAILFLLVSIGNGLRIVAGQGGGVLPARCCGAWQAPAFAPHLRSRPEGAA